MVKQNEQILRGVIGLENNRGASVATEPDYNDVAVFNEAVDMKMKQINEKIANVTQTADDIISRSNQLEIMPMAGYVLVKPYTVNPYNKITVSEGGLITDGGFNPTFKNTDTGEIEESENIMRVADVLEVGPNVKYVKEGDNVYYKKFSEVPIPFFKQGLCVVHENNIMAVINENLKERWYGN